MIYTAAMKVVNYEIFVIHMSSMACMEMALVRQYNYQETVPLDLAWVWLFQVMARGTLQNRQLLNSQAHLYNNNYVLNGPLILIRN